jgi:arginine N-succinyltransferase
MSKAIVRPATRNDLDGLDAMIARVDLGMLTMPSSRDAMAARIERSLTAFARPSAAPQNECYFLVMEEDGELLGTASIFTNLGVERPFYSYRISRDAKVSPELGVKVELDLLFLVNDFHGVIAGCHEILRRQGLLAGIWCLDPHETLGPGQKEEIDRVEHAGI